MTILRKGLESVLSITILILIIACHELLPVVLILWTLLALICLRYPRLAIEPVFFFGSFFMGVGFFQNPLLTVKHFHLGLAILLLVRLMRWKALLWKVKENWRPARVLIFWIILVALSTFSAWRIGGEWFTQGLRTNGNLFLTVICTGLLTILITPGEAMRGLGFLALGTLVRTFFGVLTQCQVPGPYFKEVILYNNHLGFYCSLALVCMLSFIPVATNRVIKRYSCVGFCFLFYALLLTCSRAGYISFFGGLISFAMIQRWLRKNDFAGSKRRSIWFILCSVCFGSVVILVVAGYLFPEEFFFPTISSRLWMTLIIFIPGYWHRFHKENFFFLGQYRLNQFHALSEIMKQHSILGIGLVRRVTDFHSLYFTLLGGIGLVGLLTFLVFCVSWMRQVFHAMVPDDEKGNLFRTAASSCMVVWLFYSFTESFFLFFNIWVIIAAGIALSKKCDVQTEV